MDYIQGSNKKRKGGNRLIIRHRTGITDKRNNNTKQRIKRKK